MSNLTGTPTLKNLIAFCVLMQSGQGISTKAPSYIKEKWSMACDNCIVNSLDSTNKAKYDKYLEVWNKSGYCEEES